MLDIRRIDARVAVAPQIDPADVAAIKAEGFTTVVNNRPDGEEPGQPTGDAVAQACAEAGLAYYAIPITHAGFTHPQVIAMAELLGAADGPVLAYCRSGTRSCHLWALATAGMGVDPDEVIAAAEGAGYDLSGARGLLDAVSPKA
jgi:uncharacterized protein (TIGR01244 family)